MNVETLVQQHRDTVYRQMIRVCHGNREDAEDALAEAILAAFHVADQLRHEEAFRVWLGRVAARVCLRMKAREALIEKVSLVGLEELALPIQAEATPEDEAVLDALKHTVRDAPSHLPTLYRTVYERVEIRGRPLNEFAQQAGISREAAKSRLRRARKMVRNRLDRAIWSAPAKNLTLRGGKYAPS